MQPASRHVRYFKFDHRPFCSCRRHAISNLPYWKKRSKPGGDRHTDKKTNEGLRHGLGLLGACSILLDFCQVSVSRMSQQNEKFLFQQSRKFLFETGKLAG